MEAIREKKSKKAPYEVIMKNIAKLCFKGK